MQFLVGGPRFRSQACIARYVSMLFLHNSAVGDNNLGRHFKDILAYAKELQKTVNMQKELEDRKVSAALTATAKRLKEERQALKQRKKERTRKV